MHGDTCTAAACSAYYYRRSTRPHFSLFTYICVLLPCCSVCCSINHEGWKSHEVTTETQGTSTVGTRRRAEQKAQTIQRFFSVHNTGTTSTTCKHVDHIEYLVVVSDIKLQSRADVCVALLLPSVLLNYEGWTLARGYTCISHHGNRRNI